MAAKFVHPRVKVTDLWVRELGQAYREVSVYRPLNQSAGSDNLRSIQAPVNKLIDLRRSWLQQQCRLGLRSLDGCSDKKWQLRFKCSPPGLLLAGHKQFHCNDHRNCCFCFGRRVFGSWYRGVLWSLFQSQEDHEVTRPSTSLVSFEDRQLLTAEVILPVSLRRPLRSQVTFTRSVPQSFPSWLGASQLSLAYIDPVWGAVVSHRIVAIVDRNDPLDHHAIADFLGRGASVVSYNHIRKSMLASALAEVCYFPYQIYSGPAKQTTRLLNLVSDSGMQLTRTYGCLRNLAQRKLVAPRRTKKHDPRTTSLVERKC